MTSSALDIWNQALSACHAKGRLSSLTENSKEREECERWYSLVLETVQEAAYWPGCETAEYLALLDTRNFSTDWTSTNAYPQYQYKYSLPANYLRAWYLVDYGRFSIHFDPVNEYRVLSTNSEKAVLVYARKQEDVNMWSASQKMATVYGLAGHIAGALTGKNELTSKNFQLANRILMDAQANSANAENDRVNFIPPQLAARGVSLSGVSERYFYPLGDVFTYARTDV